MFDGDVTDLDFAEMKKTHYYTNALACPGMFIVEMDSGAGAQKVKLFP